VKNEMVYIPTVSRPDTEIAMDIRQRLKMDVRVNAGGIEVEVMDGEVELSGLVASGAEKTLAEQLAWVTGARDVDSSALWVDFDRVAVLPKHRTGAPDVADKAIASALQKAFEMDPRVKAFAIEPMVSNGTVTLNGEVDNYVAKLAAERDARNTVGVHFVINLLKVRPNALVEDSTLLENVQSALKRSPYLDTKDLDVTVRNSRVTLSGELDSTFDIAEAYRTVAKVNGVASIKNELTATTTKIPSHGLDYAWHTYVPDAYWPFQDIPKSLDAEIKREVESQLFWSPFLDSNEIEVYVDNGTVKLTGYVDDYVERRIATKNAWEGGAEGVLNHLEVR
jgi:osmotically-inducible protein OsmY